MNTIFSKVEDFKKTLRQTFDDRITALKNEAAEKLSTLLSNFAATIIFAVVLFSSFLLLSIGLAFLIGRMIGQQFYGFAIISLLYLIIGVIIWKLRDRIIKAPILGSFRKQLFSPHTDERLQ